MTKRKKDNTNLILGIGFVVLAIVLFYGGSQGWFNFIINVPVQNQTLTVAPTPQAPVSSSCSQVCTNQGFSKFYTFINSCKEGESKVTYGYPTQAPILTCCCWNEAIQNNPTCTDSDGGINYNVGGKVTTALGIMYDTCQPNQMDLLELYCDNGIQKSSGIGCPNGCIDSANGDYCSPTKIWHSGDTVFSGSGSGSVTGEGSAYAELDLSDYGIEVDGDCRLGVQFSSSWDYGNDKCIGIPGMQGFRWEIYDSLGLEYSRIDYVPVGLGVDLHPESHIWNWDGTKWRAYGQQVPFIYPECQINYEYTVRIYIYDC